MLAERIEKQTRIRLLNAIRKKLPRTLPRPDLEMAALDYFERLGHDNHRRLCRVYGWEEKKTKSTWGANAVDYRNIAGKAVREMSMQQVQHFLIVCALVSDLYCPGYNPRQALAKDSKLARTALRYKIDPGKLAAEVRTELSKKDKGRRKCLPNLWRRGCGNKKADRCLARAVPQARPAFSTQLPYASLLHNRRFPLPRGELLRPLAIDVDAPESHCRHT